MLWVKAFGVWLGMLVAAFLNGALRELLIMPYVGEPVGHIIIRGRLLIVVWLTTLCSPLLCSKLTRG